MKSERSFIFLLFSFMQDPLSPSKGTQTKTDILQAAYDLFIRHGYHGTSMRQIAARAGLALGSIYNHFGSKEALFREVVLAYHPYHEILPILANAQHTNIADLFRHAFRLIDETLSVRPELINLLFVEMVELQSRHVPELFQRIFPFVAQVLERFTEVSGQLRPIPLPMLIRTFMGVSLGYVITKYSLGEHAPPEFRKNAPDYFIDIFLHGILKPETPA